MSFRQRRLCRNCQMTPVIGFVIPDAIRNLFKNGRDLQKDPGRRRDDCGLLIQRPV